MAAQGAGILEAIECDGYAVARGIFSADEIACLRSEVASVLAAEARPHNGGLCCTMERRGSGLARRLLDDARLAAVAGDAAAAPCFLPAIHLHSDIVHDWHVDLEPADRAAVMSAASARIYKIAIYLQDHADRDGLSVVPGSHSENGTPRAPLHLATCAGDVVTFDVRLRHAGRFPNRIERLISTIAWWLRRVRLVDDAGRQSLLRRLRFLLEPRPAVERLAIFLTFGTTQAVVQRYAALYGAYEAAAVQGLATDTHAARASHD